MTDTWFPDDINQLQQPELIREILNRYCRIMQGDGYGFWEWCLDTNTYRTGGRFWEKLGYSQEAIARVTSIDQVEEFIHPDDWGFVNHGMIKHLRFDKPIDMVYRIRAADGSYRWTQVSGSSTRDSAGRVVYITGVSFDLSYLKDTEKALRLSEARHERVLAASNDGIWEWSATDANVNPAKAGRIGKFHTSYSFWRPLGYSEEEVDAMPEDERLSVWRSHIHPHDIPKLQRALKEHFVTREPIDMDYRIFGEGGKMFWLRTRGNSFFNSHGRMIMISGINIDITQIRESEERVRKAKEDAEKANQSKSNFLSSMSHELRTPLNSILGFSKLLSSDDSLSLAQRENANYIHDAGKHLLQLISDILDLAQIEAGKLSLSLEPVLPQKIVSECFNYCRNLAQERNISLTFDPGVMRDNAIYVDAVRLRQCLLNLLNNAIKYNVDDGQVFVHFSQLDGDLEIAVSDTGLGIPEAKRDSLFSMFNRLGAERSSIEGSGIGLVITKQLATAMGGNLIYCDKTAKGACFKLYFPIVEEYANPTAMAEVVDPMAQLINIDLPESKTIFYVEDNESNIRLLEAWLNSCPKLTINSQVDPFLGLYQIRQTMPDMVILDINLPGISGHELLQVLKEDPATANIPVVALSASAMARDVKHGLEMGFDEYLTKPLDVDKLAATLSRFFVKEAA